jgi:hypothetical protein
VLDDKIVSKNTTESKQSDFCPLSSFQRMYHSPGLVQETDYSCARKGTVVTLRDFTCFGDFSSVIVPGDWVHPAIYCFPLLVSKLCLAFPPICVDRSFCIVVFRVIAELS